jgi:hypothetical protein
MGERKAKSASARGLHRFKELPLSIVAGGRAWGVALVVSPVLEDYLEDWARRTACTVTFYRSGVRSVTYVNKFCKPLDLKQSDYIIKNILSSLYWTSRYWYLYFTVLKDLALRTKPQ